jgi:hypothetical protein
MWKKWMRCGLVLGLLALTLPVQGQAATCPGLDRQLVPIQNSHETLTVAAVAVPFSATKYTQGGYNAALALISVETGAISYTLDGTTPTTIVGHQVVAGTHFEICGLEAIKGFRATQVAVPATLKVTYFRAR